jgi:hypothetical protein
MEKSTSMEVCKGQEHLLFPSPTSTMACDGSAWVQYVVFGKKLAMT